MRLAASADAAETQRWQVVSANEIKVGHALVTRTASDSNVIESERIEIRLGKTDRRVRYRMIVETESAPDGALRRVSREVQTSEGHSRVEARVVDEELEVTHGLGRAQTTCGSPARRSDLKSEEAARAWLRPWAAAKAATVQLPVLGSREARGGRCRAGAQLVGSGNVERRVRSSRGTTGSLLRVDASGDIVRETMALGSFELTRQDATEEQAQARDQVFDHIAPLLQKSPYRIPSRDMNEKIRYQL